MQRPVSKYDRHNVPLRELARDVSPSYRPSKELVALVEANWAHACTAGDLSLDRPMVPLLNALVASGVPTRMSCADGYLSTADTSLNAEEALLRVARFLPGVSLELKKWEGLSEPTLLLRWASGLTIPHWTADQVDRGLRLAAEAIRDKPLAGISDPIASALWLDGAWERLRAAGRFPDSLEVTVSSSDVQRSMGMPPRLVSVVLGDEYKPQLSAAGLNDFEFQQRRGLLVGILCGDITAPVDKSSASTGITPLTNGELYVDLRLPGGLRGQLICQTSDVAKATAELWQTLSGGGVSRNVGQQIAG